MKTELVGQLTLDSGGGVWIVYHVVDWMDPPPMTGKPRFGKGKKAEDIEGEGLRILAWKQEPDGSIVFCDAPARARRKPISS
jgi:hypothetical protein